MRKIIIDTDPGIDDAFAIVAIALCQEFEILGVCSVGGNKGLELTTNNALSLMRWLNVPAPVYQGAAQPLNPKGGASHTDDTIHGKNGLGGVTLPENPAALAKESAEDFILAMAEKYPGEVEILALGPLTNLALAAEKNEAAFRKLKAIYSMGGGVHCGNVTPVAEFNYWFDPEAVERVLKITTEVPFYMLGLDVTNQVIFTHEDIFFLDKEGGEKGKLLAQMVRSYLDLFWNKGRILGCVIHDLTAALFMLQPELASPEQVFYANVQMATEGVARGQTVVDLAGFRDLPKNAFVVMGIQADACKQKFIELLLPEKAELYRKYVQQG